MENDFDPDGDSLKVVNDYMNGMIGVHNLKQNGEAYFTLESCDLDQPIEWNYTIQDIQGLTDSATLVIYMPSTNYFEITNESYLGEITLYQITDTTIDMNSWFRSGSTTRMPHEYKVTATTNCTAIGQNNAIHVTIEENYVGTCMVAFTVSNGCGSSISDTLLIQSEQ